MNTNKSILYQLAKYQTPKEEEPKIDVPDKDPIYEFQPILDKLWSECPIRKTIEEKKIFEKKMLKLLTIPPKSKLYPDITYIRYHLFYAHQYMTSEQNCNKEIMNFAKAQDPETYRKQFFELYSKTAQKITLLKALQATFRYGIEQTKHDKLPEEYKSKICRILGLPSNIELGKTCIIQEQTIKSSCIKDKILGTVGYKILWTMSKEGGNLPLLEGPIETS
jgi:hypothetical protein